MEKFPDKKFADKLFDLSLDPMLILNKGVFTYCNEATLKLLKFDTIDQLLGKAPSDISPEQQPDGNYSSEKIKDLIRIAGKDGYHRFEWVHLNSKGEEIWMDVSLNSIPDFNGTAFYTIWRDITELKITQKELERSKNNYRNTLESITEVVFKRDLNNVLTFVSNQCFELCGYYDYELIGKTWETIISSNPNNEHAILRANEFKKNNYRAAIKSELEIIHRDGSLISLEINERIIYENEKQLEIIGSARNISEEKHMGIALHKSEAKYRRFVEQSPDITYIYSSKRGALFCSTRTKDILGFENGFYENDPFMWHNAIHKDDIESTLQIMHNFDPVKGFEVEYRIQDTRGNWHNFLDRSINCVVKDDEVIVEGIAIDITEKKVIENALLFSEKKYRFLFENMLNAFALHEIVLNEDSVVVDYIFLEINNAFQKHTGLSKKDVIGKKVSDVLPNIKEDPANWMEIYGKVALTGEQIKFDQYSESLKRWYSINCFSPKKGQFATIFEDISMQVETQIKLKQNEQKLSNLLNNLPGIVYRCKNNNKWDMEYINGSVFSILGYNPSDIIQNNKISYAEIIHPEDRLGVNEQINIALVKNERFSIKYRIIKSTGEIRFVFEQGIGIRNKNGVAEYIEGYINDITEQTIAQLELENHKIKLEETIDKRTADLQDKNKQLKQQNSELEKYNELFVGREFRIKELRNKVAYLEQLLKNNISE
ncbi:MAG: PAS domain S-box protein [Salinivirgaceae bacterium]|nr:PAS domain S-box protein [Salinivirgaceae bacterium]